MTDKFSISDTISAIRDAGSRFDSQSEQEGDSLHFSTRDSGDVGGETAGSADIQAGRTLINTVEAAHPNVRGVLHTVDEWTNVTFRAYDQAVPKRMPSRMTTLAALDACGQLFAKKTAAHGFRVRWSPTSHEMLVEWRDPAKTCREAVAHLSIAREGNDTVNVQTGNSLPDIKSLEWSLTLQIGRHKVPLTGLEEEDFSKALNTLSRSTDGLKDIFPLSYVIAKSKGGYVARYDYDGTKPAVHSKDGAWVWAAREGAEKTAKSLGGVVIEQRRGYPDKPVEGEPSLTGRGIASGQVHNRADASINRAKDAGRPCRFAVK